MCVCVYEAFVAVLCSSGAYVPLKMLSKLSTSKQDEETTVSVSHCERGIYLTLGRVYILFYSFNTGLHSGIITVYFS